MTPSHRRQVRAWLVLLVAIGAVLGHVMSLHAHAEDPTTASAAGGHDDNDDPAVYRASCEALRTIPAQVPTTAVTASTLGPPPPLPREVARVPTPVVRAGSPPLFLLHAALLI